MVGKPSGDALDGCEHVNGGGMPARAEFARVKLLHDSVNVDDNFGAGELRVPGGEHEEIGHVEDVEQIVGAALVPTEQPEEKATRKRGTGRRCDRRDFSVLP
jgi:hypothetical protein